MTSPLYVSTLPSPQKKKTYTHAHCLSTLSLPSPTYASPPTCNRRRSSWFAATPPTTASARTPFGFSLAASSLLASLCCFDLEVLPPLAFRPSGRRKPVSPKASPMPAPSLRNSFSPKVVLALWNSASPKFPPLGLWNSVSPKLLRSCGFDAAQRMQAFISTRESGEKDSLRRRQSGGWGGGVGLAHYGVVTTTACQESLARE